MGCLAKDKVMPVIKKWNFAFICNLINEIWLYIKQRLQGICGPRLWREDHMYGFDNAVIKLLK